VCTVVVSTGVVGMAAPPAAGGATVDGGVDAAVEAFGATAAVLSSRGDVRLEESAVVAGRRAPRLRNSGGATMTIAVSSNARKKRLSID